MCDYSLEMYASRPAREGEIYQTTRFPSGSIGLAAGRDCGTAICVQYDTRLSLENIPPAVRRPLGLGEAADATFVRLEAGAYRDGLRFDNGKEISLQQLGTGVRVTIPILIEHTEPMKFTPEFA
ncbi:MAG: hypothetical protein ACK4MV_07455 [Beijerinckiaceae bacterium]